MKALLIIDMQGAILDRIEAGLECVNPQAPDRISALAAHYRHEGWPVLHVRHSDPDPRSPFHESAAGYRPMACERAEAGEAIFVKRTSSAFASTDLAEHLQEQGITDLAVTGAVAGFCVNSTVRAGSDLGFDMTVIEDAVIGFELPGADLTARAIFDVTMALLKQDFAKVVTAEMLLSS